MDLIRKLCRIIAENMRNDPDISQTDLIKNTEKEITASSELTNALKVDRRMQQVIQNGGRGFQTIL